MTRRTDQTRLPGRDRHGQIGFSQRVRLEWLEQTANLILAGNDKAAVNDALQELLKNKVSVGGNARGCNRSKVIGILSRVWVSHLKNSFHCVTMVFVFFLLSPHHSVLIT